MLIKMTAISNLIVLFLFIAICNRSTAVSQSSRISGGVEVDPNDGAAWVASYQIKPLSSFYPTHVCGAAILSDKWVITAASCLYDISTYKYQVRTNTLDYNYEGSEHEINRWVIHPDYNPETKENNIALIETVEFIYFGGFNTAGVINLPGQYFYPKDGSEFKIHGWGAKLEGGSATPQLNFVKVKVVDRDICNEAYNGTVTSTEICAASPIVGTGICNYDEGSPMVAQNQLHGIASHGRLCGKEGFPYIYTRVSAYREWIFETTGIN